MKKQILFLALFVFALFSSLTDAYGQAVHWSIPRPFTCEDDALHPIAGVRYTYEADVTDPTGTGQWRFWATKDANFITTNATTGERTFNFGTGTALAVVDGQLSYASNDYNIAITTPATANANTDGTIELIWSSTILAGTEYQVTPTFVVAYYENADGCTDNIKVWELDPLNGFIVDVRALDPAALATKDTYDPATPPETCVDVVESATYASGTMSYDYGDNYLYYEFIAANFTDHWVPTFEIDPADLGPTQAVTSYEYTFATPDTWATTPTWTTLVSGTTEISPANTVTDISQGVSIFVRVRIDHNQYELIADQSLTMTLDGQNADGVWDVHNDDCTELNPPARDGYDTAIAVITQRPEIPEDTPTVSPLTPNVDIIPGNNQ